MLASQFAFQFHELHEPLFGQHLKKYFLQCAVALGGIVIIQISQHLINSLSQYICINLVVCRNIPFVCEESLVRKSYYSIFRYGNVEFRTHHCDRLVHVLHAEVFAYQAEKMFRSASDHDFRAFKVDKLQCISDEISPCTCVGAHEQCIFFSFFHFMDHLRIRLCYHVAVGVEVLIIKRHKLEEDIIIQDELHSLRMLACLVTDEA